MPARRGSSYPAPFRGAVEGREKRPLGDASGLTQFGVNLSCRPAAGPRNAIPCENEFVLVLG